MTSGDIAISVRDLTKTYRLFNCPADRIKQFLTLGLKQYHQGFTALKGISFDILKGECVGIIGRNGSGKSTLLQMVCGILKPTAGIVTVDGRVSALLELGAGFNPEFTGRENVYFQGALMGFDKAQMDECFDDITAFADIGRFMDQPVRTYSSGMYVRLAFSVAIHVAPDILVVDEALGVGDSRFQHFCFQRIHEFMEQGKTILMVSHNTDALLRVCHRGIVIDTGELRHIGTISNAVNFYDGLLYGSGRTRSATPSTPTTSATGMPPSRSLSATSPQGNARDVIAEKPCYNSDETRLGNGAARIIDFDLIVDGEINPPEIRANQDILLIVKILFNETIKDVSLGFAILSTDGTYVGGTNFDMLNLPLLSGDPGQCIAVRFPWKSHIAGGEYFLNLGCHQFINGGKCFLDVRRSVAKFKFADTPSVGLVDLDVNKAMVRVTEAEV